VSLPAQSNQEIRQLRIGNPIERELAGGQVHVYQITLAADQFLQVGVEQRGIDVVVNLFGPGDQKLAEVDSPNGEYGPEAVFWITKASGQYRVEIRSLEKTAGAGRYEARIVELRAATPQDRPRVAGEGALAEAEGLRAQSTGESLRGAIKKYEEALGLFREARRRAGEAEALGNLGLVYHSLRQADKSLAYLRQALPIWQDLNHPKAIADTLNNLGIAYSDLNQTDQALEHLNRSLEIKRTLKDPREEAPALSNIGEVYQSMNQPDKAIDYYNQALALWRVLKDAAARREEAKTLGSLAIVHRTTGQYEKARELYLQSLELSRATKDRGAEHVTLAYLGDVCARLGESAQALEFYQRAITFFRELGDRATEANLLGSISGVYQDLGERQKALDIAHESLKLVQPLRAPRLEARKLNDLGVAYHLLDENQQALTYYEQALELYRKANDSLGQGEALSNLGVAYYYLGENERAQALYAQALPLFQAAKYRRGEAYALSNLGVVYRDLGKPKEAVEHHNLALQIRRELKVRAEEAASLRNLGLIYQFDLGERRKALAHYERSLALTREVKDRAGEAESLHKIGTAYFSLDDPDQAFEYLNQALAFERELEDKRGESLTLHALARVERARNNLAQARAHFEAALNLFESRRARLVNPELRASFFSQAQSCFAGYIDLLMQLDKQRPSAGLAALALQTSERARARSLLETLSEVRVDLRQSVDPALLERERSLQQLISAKADRQIRLLSRKHTTEQAEAVAREIESLTAERQRVEDQIRAASPRYAALTQPTPLTLAGIQRQLGADTLLLEYALGEERSFLWAVTPNSLVSFALPKRAEIEEAANQLYELLTARAQPKADESPAQQQSRIAQADAGYAAAAARLSRMLLAPVAAHLGKKRLVIAGDGRLQLIPFSILPKPGAGDRGLGAGKKNPQSPIPNPQPLIFDHEIIQLPSASTLAALRRELAGRKPAPKDVAMLADPVFDVTDLRVKRDAVAVQPPAKSQSEPAQNITTRAVEDWLKAGLTLDRLVFSQREAAVIRTLVPESRRKLALGFDVNYRTATDPELGQYRIVHFSTHGLLNSRQPELSGILLSLVDEQGRPQENGLLRLGELYNLKLPVELVVLSSCQTALGREVRGEGLVGLTQGFMYAGAARVMASLWKVDDQATAELMQRFYKEMLGPQPSRPAEALRRAQIAMWRNKKWSAPFYWGAFTIQGEWR
jgi:tetratricopeptide (TPR) repeat protein